MGLKVGDKVRLTEQGKLDLSDYPGYPGDGAVLTVVETLSHGSVWTDSFGFLASEWFEPLVETCLTRAQEIVDGPRRAAYGHPKENHARTAKMWSAYLGVPITERQVCMLNILQKASRDAHSSKQDNLDDIAGWARNAEIVSG